MTTRRKCPKCLEEWNCRHQCKKNVDDESNLYDCFCLDCISKHTREDKKSQAFLDYFYSWRRDYFIDFSLGKIIEACYPDKVKDYLPFIVAEEL